MKHIKNSEVTQGNTYIKPGIYHNINIESLEYGETPNGKPYLKFSYTSPDGEVLEDDGWFVSENAEDYTLNKLKHLAKAIGQENNIYKAYDKAEENGIDSYEDFITYLQKVFVGATVPTMKFGGKQIEGKNGGQPWTKAVTPGFPPFASSEEENHNLTFNDNRDVEYLETTQNEEAVTEETSDDEELF